MNEADCPVCSRWLCPKCGSNHVHTWWKRKGPHYRLYCCACENDWVVKERDWHALPPRVGRELEAKLMPWFSSGCRHCLGVGALNPCRVCGAYTKEIHERT